MTVVLVEPEKKARIAEIESDLKSMQQVVGGLIQPVYPFEDKVALVCNDEGKLEGLPLNRALRDEDGEIYDIVAGTFFVCGLGEEDFDSLPPELQDKYLEKYRQPEMFMRNAFSGEIMAVKIPEKKKTGRSQYER